MKTHDLAWFSGSVALLMLNPLGSFASADQTLAVFTKSLGNPISKATRAGVEIVAKANNFKVFNYVPTSPDNVPQQTALVDEAIKLKPDAILFTPVDTKAMVPAAAKITAAGIPLVNVSDRLAGGSVTAFVTSDDQAIASATARALFTAMGGKGNVVILEGPPNIPSAPARMEGFKAALKDFPDVKVILSKNANYARPSASDLLKSMLRLNPPPQIDGVLAANDAMAFGAIEALKAANKKALVVGINGSKEAVDLIKAGDMLASGDYNGHSEGCIAAEIAIRTLRHETTPNEVIIKSVVVDKSNYQNFESTYERRPCPELETITLKRE